MYLSRVYTFTVQANRDTSWYDLVQKNLHTQQVPRVFLCILLYHLITVFPYSSSSVPLPPLSSLSPVFSLLSSPLPVSLLRRQRQGRSALSRSCATTQLTCPSSSTTSTPTRTPMPWSVGNLTHYYIYPWPTINLLNIYIHVQYMPNLYIQCMYRYMYCSCITFKCPIHMIWGKPRWLIVGCTT